MSREMRLSLFSKKLQPLSRQPGDRQKEYLDDISMNTRPALGLHECSRESREETSQAACAFISRLAAQARQLRKQTLCADMKALKMAARRRWPPLTYIRQEVPWKYKFRCIQAEGYTFKLERSPVTR